MPGVALGVPKELGGGPFFGGVAAAGDAPWALFILAKDDAVGAYKAPPRGLGFVVETGVRTGVVETDGVFARAGTVTIRRVVEVVLVPVCCGFRGAAGGCSFAVAGVTVFGRDWSWGVDRDLLRVEDEAKRFGTALPVPLGVIVDGFVAVCGAATG